MVRIKDVPFYPEKDLYGLVGISPAMQGVFHAIVKASQSKEAVLITGETGTGKELAARSIHQIGIKRHKPFVPIDCSALPPTLIETELFGYVRGAFTGATCSKRGLFEAAAAGTAFLDEITEMPPDMQCKLLRVLQEQEVRPVGGISSIRCNARIIAASNCDLQQSLREGKFRKDLYYRLSVLVIEMPALREHKEDIPLLANHFLAKCSLGKTDQTQLSSSALDCLTAYDWPGNVRELENCMRRAVAWGASPVIYPDDLPPRIQNPEVYRQAQLEIEQPTSLDELERRAILHAIDRANGDKILASRLLGIGKTTIYRKLKQYHLLEE